MHDYLAVLANLLAGRPRRGGESDDRGATATEYAILVAFIAVAIALAVTAFGTELASFFSGVYSKLGFR